MVYFMISTKELQQTLTKDIQKLTIFFDIDDTLATHSLLANDEKLYIYRKSMFIIAQNREHQVLPGVIELMQFLFANPLVNVSFFSSAPHARNLEFVKALLIKALGEEKYLEIASSISILSRENLTTLSGSQSQEMYKNFGLRNGNFKKDVFQAVTNESSKKQRILVGDDPTYIQFGQEANFLRSPSGRTEYYNEMRKLELDEDSQKWRAKQRFYKYNSVFYLAGVLSDCIETFTKGLDVTKFLFQMHFKQSSDKLFGFQPNYECIEDKSYHEKGLAALKTVNPEICYVSREDYIAKTSTAPTELEYAVIEDIKSKQGQEECCVM